MMGVDGRWGDLRVNMSTRDFTLPRARYIISSISEVTIIVAEFLIIVDDPYVIIRSTVSSGLKSYQSFYVTVRKSIFSSAKGGYHAKNKSR